MTDDKVPPMAGAATMPPGDLILPFQIEATHLRGRLVRLGPALAEVLRHHDYPALIKQSLGELLALAAALSAALKYEGIFTLQIKGNGPVKLMVADATHAGDLRGYAQFDAEAVAKLAKASERPSVPKLFGAGYLAFTVDQGQHTDRYQGIVELTGGSLADCVHHYFQQSEQLQAALLVASQAAPDGSGWYAGALMLQRLPSEGGHESGGESDMGDPGAVGEEAEDGWRRALALMASCSVAELTDPTLAPEALLYRLFHEDGIRVYRPVPLAARCRCSRERVERMLRALPSDELESMAEEGQASVACEFCGRAYAFSKDELTRLAVAPPA